MSSRANPKPPGPPPPPPKVTVRTVLGGDEELIAERVLPPEPKARPAHVCVPPDEGEIRSLWGCRCGRVWVREWIGARTLEPWPHRMTYTGWVPAGWRASRRYWRRIRGGER